MLDAQVARIRIARLVCGRLLAGFEDRDASIAVLTVLIGGAFYKRGDKIFDKPGCVRSSTLSVLVQSKVRRCAVGFPEGVDGLLVLSRAPEALDKDGVFLRVFRSPAIEPGGGWGEDKQEKDYSVFARENMI